MTLQGTPAQAPQYDGMMNTAAHELRAQAAELSRQADYSQLLQGAAPPVAPQSNPANVAFQVAGGGTQNNLTGQIQGPSDPAAQGRLNLPAAGGAYIPTGTSTVPIPIQQEQQQPVQQPVQQQPTQEMVLVRMQDGSVGQVAAASLNQPQPVQQQQVQQPQVQQQPLAPAQGKVDSKALNDTIMNAANKNQLAQSMNSYQEAVNQLNQTQASVQADINRQEDINNFINRQPNSESRSEKQMEFSGELNLLTTRIGTANTQVMAQQNLIQQLKQQFDNSSHQVNLETLAHINPVYGTESGFNQLAEQLAGQFGFTAEEIRTNKDPRMLAMAAAALGNQGGQPQQPMPQQLPQQLPQQQTQYVNVDAPPVLAGVPQVAPQAIVSNVGGFHTPMAGQGNLNEYGFLQPNDDPRIMNQGSDEGKMDAASAFLGEMMKMTGSDF